MTFLRRRYSRICLKSVIDRKQRRDRAEDQFCDGVGFDAECEKTDPDCKEQEGYQEAVLRGGWGVAAVAILEGDEIDLRIEDSA